MRRKRILIYSHDTYGLGHIRRNLAIAEAIVKSSDDVTILIATGSPRAHAFGTPEGVDFLKIPTIVKRTEGGYRPRSLRLSLPDTLRVRAEMLIGATRAFEPDMLLVDHAIVGVERELVPLFEAANSLKHRPIFVYGMREIVDDVESVKSEWTKLDAWRHIDHTFDHVLVYGDPRVLTTAHELGLTARLPGKVTWVGYVGRQSAESPRVVNDKKTVLVTTGGGGDGAQVLTAYAEFLETHPLAPSVNSVVVGGPFLARQRRARIKARFDAIGPGVRFIDFTESMDDLIGIADAVVSMAGYNAVAELLAARKPALLVPRCVPRREQWLRAQRLSPHAGFRCVKGEECTAQSIADFLTDAFSRTEPVSCGLSLDGAKRSAEVLNSILDARTKKSSVRTLREAVRHV